MTNTYKKQDKQSIAAAKLLRIKKDIQAHEERQNEYRIKKMRFDNLFRSESQHIANLKKELYDSIDELKI